MKTLLVLFKNIRLDKEQTEALRKDINIRTDNRYDLLHNHKADGSVIYRYPLVHFRAFKGYAALLGINEGHDLLWNLLGRGELGEPFSSNYEIIRKDETVVAVGSDFYTYSLKDIIPFNGENYRIYRKLESLTERTAFLEDKLAGQLVQFCKEFGVKFEKGEIRLRLKSLRKVPEPELKREKVLAFDAIIQTNVSLPDYLSLGRMKSLGWGTLKRIRP